MPASGPGRWCEGWPGQSSLELYGCLSQPFGLLEGEQWLQYAQDTSSGAESEAALVRRLRHWQR